MKLKTHLEPSSFLWFGTPLRQLIPPVCWSCQKWLVSKKISPEGYPFLCSHCLWELPWIDPAYSCQHCGNLTSAPNLKNCSFCYQESFSFERLWSGFQYEGKLQTWILQCKFGKNEHLLKMLGRLLALSLSHYSELPQVDAVLPIPLHQKRLFYRGFNQALLLANHTFSDQQLIHKDWLKRTKATKPQTEIPPQLRHDNVENAFEASSCVLGKKILLIDDVMTTGATLNSAAKALKATGAASVDILVLARRMHLETTSI